MEITYDVLVDVNHEFNQYEYETEITDDWTPIDLTADKKDDCDSYATAKAEKLLKLGCPRSWIKFGKCWVYDGYQVIGAHLVTLVTLYGQTYCLDNRFTFPKPVQELVGIYVWIKFWHLDDGKWYLPEQLNLGVR